MASTLPPPILPLISIIIPAHNCEKTLRAAIVSALLQTYEGPVEISIYNDGSSDGTEEVVLSCAAEFASSLIAQSISTKPLHATTMADGGLARSAVMAGKGEDASLFAPSGAASLPSSPSFAGPRSLIYSSHISEGAVRAHGPGFARNRAIEQSSGQFLCLLDSDDECRVQRVEKQLLAALQHSQCAQCQMRRGGTEGAAAVLSGVGAGTAAAEAMAFVQEAGEEAAAAATTTLSPAAAKPAVATAVPLTASILSVLSSMAACSSCPPLSAAGLGVLVGSGFTRDGSTDSYTSWANALSPSELYLQQWRECTLIQPTYFLSRLTYAAIGGFAEEMPEVLQAWLRQHGKDGGKDEGQKGGKEGGAAATANGASAPVQTAAGGAASPNTAAPAPASPPTSFHPSSSSLYSYDNWDTRLWQSEGELPRHAPILSLPPARIQAHQLSSHHFRSFPEDTFFLHRHLALGGKLVRCEEELLFYRYSGESQSWAIPRGMLMQARVALFEERILFRRELQQALSGQTYADKLRETMVATAEGQRSREAAQGGGTAASAARGAGKVAEGTGKSTREGTGEKPAEGEEQRDWHSTFSQCWSWDKETSGACAAKAESPAETPSSFHSSSSASSSSSCGLFTIWGSGRDGKDFYRCLSPAAKARVSCFAEIDERKAGQWYPQPSKQQKAVLDGKQREAKAQAKRQQTAAKDFGKAAVQPTAASDAVAEPAAAFASASASAAPATAVTPSDAVTKKRRGLDGAAVHSAAGASASASASAGAGTGAAVDTSASSAAAFYPLPVRVQLPRDCPRPFLCCVALATKHGRGDELRAVAAELGLQEGKDLLFFV